MADRVRVAMVGAGSMANTVHYPSLASFDDVEIAAICDLNTQRLNATADKYHVERRYADYKKMVEEVAPDAVYAIGPPDVMYPIWVWLLQQKQNLYIEKPMGMSAHQARSLADLAEKAATVTQVSFQRRACPIAVKLRDECLKRGPIAHAVCEFYKCQPKSNFDALDHMMGDGVHALDTLRWMCRGEVVEIESVSRRVGTHDLNFFAVLLRFDNEATGVMMCSWSSGRRTFRVQMHAPSICAEVELEGKGFLYADGDTQGVCYDTREVSGGDQLYIFGGFQAKNREFIDCVKHGGTPGSSFSDALKTMELADRILALALLD